MSDAAEIENLRAANLSLVGQMHKQAERIAELESLSGSAAAFSAHIPNDAFDILKPIMIGEYSELFTAINEDGESTDVDVMVSWTTTKQIIGDAITALKGTPHEG